MCPSAAFEAEVLRINGRFNAEIIEALSVCPYAAPARRAGGSVRRVLASEVVTEHDLLAVATELATDDTIEVAQVILPRVALDAKAMLELGQRFGALNAARAAERPGGEGRAKRPTFVHAVFHPDLPYKVDTPAQLVPFFRRSPDPFVQMVRLAVLDDLHAKRPRGTQFFDGSPDDLARLLAEKPVKSITDVIGEDNHRAALHEGNLERIQAILADILVDRARAYASFAAITEGREHP